MAPTPTPTDTLDVDLTTASTLVLSLNNTNLNEMRLKALEILLELAKVEAANDSDRRQSFVNFVLVFGVIGVVAYLIHRMFKACEQDIL